MIECKTTMAREGDQVIVVLQRGFVATGKYSQVGDYGQLCQAAIVRRWGTTKGLGELASNGPLKDTKLDPCPPISFHIREAVMIMECDQNAWE